jgi:hypothetical protein
MSTAAKQQGFDTTVALFTKKIVSIAAFSILIKVKDLDSLIENLDELKEALTNIREHARANHYPEDTKVRCGELLPLNRNQTQRGGVAVLTPVKKEEVTKKPLKNLNAKKGNKIILNKGKPPKSQGETLMMFLRRARKALTSTDLGERMGLTSTETCKLLHTLQNDGKVKRRKATKAEKTSAQVRYVYEAAA